MYLKCLLNVISIDVIRRDSIKSTSIRFGNDSDKRRLIISFPSLVCPELLFDRIVWEKDTTKTIYYFLNL